jgi:hypothetical protein
LEERIVQDLCGRDADISTLFVIEWNELCEPNLGIDLIRFNDTVIAGKKYRMVLNVIDDRAID